MSTRIPNFRGRHALILHRLDSNAEAILDQLDRLGAHGVAQWPVERAGLDGADVVFFDSDMGFDELFAWKPGAATVPLIAVLGSEAPGRIEWTLAQEPSAYLMKPVGSTGVFSALSIAFHNFSLKRSRQEALQRIEERLHMRGTVLRATLALMKRHDIGEEEALGLLRAESMRRRMTLEAFSSLVTEGKWLGTSDDGRRRLQSRTGGKA
jgi:AmiR/NasT family two-component response regulator